MKIVFPPKLYLGFLLFFLSTHALSQITISGLIQGVDGERVSFATVALLDKDSIMVKAEYTNEDGRYTFRQVRPGSYRMQVRNIEYVPFTSEFITVDNASIEVPAFVMRKATTELEEVVVEGQRPLIEIHPDKMVFNVAESVNASGNDGLNLIGKAPGVILDPDNNIVLAGKTGVRIFINGRPSRLSGDDLTAMLQSMQSDNIESVEIITNPSAKYEAEGNSGIINIVLKKNANLGLNGSLNSSFTTGTYDRMNYGGSLNYRNDKVNAYGTLSKYDNNIQDDFDHVIEQNGFFVGQRSIGLSNNNGLNGTLGLDYFIDDRNTLGILARSIWNDRTVSSNSESPITRVSDGVVQEVLIARNIQAFDSKNLNYNLNYEHKLTGGGTISTDFNYGDYRVDGTTNQPNTYYESDLETVRQIVDNEDTRFTDIALFAAKLDFEKTVGSWDLSLGGKYSSITTDNGFQFYDVVNGARVLNLDQSNVFEYTEDVTAVYLILSSKISEKINTNVGLRMEHTESRGLLTSEVAIANNDVKRSYTDLFPNLGISLKPNKDLSINFGLGRRIQRPDYQTLNPFEFKLNEINFFKGNPFLTPQYTMNYQASFSHKQALTGSIVYSRTRDFFAQILDTARTTVTFLIPKNLQRITNLSFNIGYPVTVTDWWEMRGGFNFTLSTFDGNLEGTVIDLSARIYNFRISNSLNLPKGFKADLTYFYNSDFIWRGSINVGSFSRIDGGLSKTLAQKKLTLRFTFSDLFNKGSDYRYSGNYGGLEVNGVRSRDNQRFGAGLTYNFGNQKVKSARRRRTGLDDEINRISN